MVLLWTAGDVFKTTYFITNQSPVQFWLCGSVQILIDVAILLQVLLYSQDTRVKLGWVRTSHDFQGFSLDFCERSKTKSSKAKWIVFLKERRRRQPSSKRAYSPQNKKKLSGLYFVWQFCDQESVEELVNSKSILLRPDTRTSSGTCALFLCCKASVCVHVCAHVCVHVCVLLLQRRRVQRRWISAIGVQQWVKAVDAQRTETLPAINLKNNV